MQSFVLTPTTTPTIAAVNHGSPLRKARTAADRVNPLAEFDGHGAVFSVQSQFSLRGNDLFFVLNRTLWLSIVDESSTKIRVLRGKLARQVSGDRLTLRDEDGLVIGSVAVCQIVGWSNDSQRELEASAAKQLEDCEDFANHAWLVDLLNADAARQMELAA